MKKNNKRFSNRDGYKVEEVTGLQNILFDLKPNRCESEVYINSKIDMTSFVEYMANLKKKNQDLGSVKNCHDNNKLGDNYFLNEMCVCNIKTYVNS